MNRGLQTLLGRCAITRSRGDLREATPIIAVLNPRWRAMPKSFSREIAAAIPVNAVIAAISHDPSKHSFGTSGEAASHQ